MKIRNGFVSNSSSSSFLIYGVCIERSTIQKFINTTTEEDDDPDANVYDWLEENIPDGYKYEMYPYDDSVFIGKSWDEVGDDQTGRQFKAQIESTIKSVLPDVELSFSTFEEAWHD